MGCCGSMWDLGARRQAGVSPGGHGACDRRSRVAAPGGRGQESVAQVLDEGPLARAGLGFRGWTWFDRIKILKL